MKFTQIFSIFTCLLLTIKADSGFLSTIEIGKTDLATCQDKCKTIFNHCALSPSTKKTGPNNRGGICNPCALVRNDCNAKCDKQFQTKIVIVRIVEEGHLVQ